MQSASAASPGRFEMRDNRSGEQIQAEMIELLKEQTETVEKEVYGGLTQFEEQEYGVRKERIDELQAELHIRRIA
jgi:hypothetical protein